MRLTLGHYALAGVALGACVLIASLIATDLANAAPDEPQTAVRVKFHQAGFYRVQCRAWTGDIVPIEGYTYEVVWWIASPRTLRINHNPADVWCRTTRVDPPSYNKNKQERL